MGLGVLIAGLVVGVFLVLQTQTIKTKASQTVVPTNLTLVNLSSTSASVFWQTETSTTGFIQAGTSKGLGLTFQEERDLGSPDNHQFHFVTLSNLTPNTIYYYKINSGTLLYPKDEFLSFQTTADILPSLEKPIIGTVVEEDLKPTEEALVILDIDGAQKLATITKASGNFILPLSNLKTHSLTENFNIESVKPGAKLTIIGKGATSTINIKLPLSDQILPTIILGQNKDFTLTPTLTIPDKTRYDINKDGVINSYDFGIIRENFGKNPKRKEVDLNQDSVVDQKDLDIINKYIPNTPPG